VAGEQPEGEVELRGPPEESNVRKDRKKKRSRRQESDILSTPVGDLVEDEQPLGRHNAEPGSEPGQNRIRRKRTKRDPADQPAVVSSQDAREAAR
jgi:hypothetical protein